MGTLELAISIIGVLGFAWSEIMALNPKWKSNGICHWVTIVFSIFQKKEK